MRRNCWSTSFGISDPHRRNAHYIPCGVFGSWKVGKSTKWCAKKREHMNSVEYVKFQHQIVDIKRQRDTERTKMRGKAAKLAERIYRGCPPFEPNHPYLIRKRISPYCARQCGKNLVLPIKNIEGKIWSLQHIMPSGRDSGRTHLCPCRTFMWSKKIIYGLAG